MPNSSKNTGGTPGAHPGPDDGLFQYSIGAWSDIEAALGALSDDQRFELRMIASGFMTARSRKEQFEAERLRQDRYLRVADAAQGLVDALRYAGLPPRPDIEQMVRLKRALARSSRESEPANAAKPDRAYFLFRLCSYWERTAGVPPSTRFNPAVLRGNQLVGQKYGPSVDFVIAAGTEPLIAKGQRGVTADIAADAINSFNSDAAAELELEHDRRLLDDLVDPRGKIGSPEDD